MGTGKKKNTIREIVEAIVIALVLALIIRAFIIQAFKIPSGSMEDTLLIGDQIIISKFAYGIQVPKPAMINVLGIRVPFFETKLYRAWGALERGDIIVFRYPGDRDKDYIKRVVGLPGEKVELKDRVIYINGAKWDETYGVHKGTQFGETSERNVNFGPYTVPEGRVFVMGDNRERSSDSRYWGTLPIYDIKGKAFIIYWSWDSGSGWLRFRRLANIVR